MKLVNTPVKRVYPVLHHYDLAYRIDFYFTEEEKPKKVLRANVTTKFDDKAMEIEIEGLMACPDCGANITYEASHDTFYCPYCGQRLDWNV